MNDNSTEKKKFDLTAYKGKSVSEYISDFFGHVLDLRDGLDRKGTVQSIRNNIAMQGANVWLLMCSIFIASIGLDLNSPAVIIGAMLISPLMSPILGLGLAIGTYDRRMFFKSIINYVIAIAVALTVSILYFVITPFGEITDEIMARTSPTLLDVGVAFFGGIAGIVATSRKDLINAVPGVAIATALMPPLCVSGFGIANLDWEIFSGSIYLFFLNTVFVSLATYIIVRLLRFPYTEYLNRATRLKSQIMFFGFAALLVIPSALKLVNILQDVREQQQIERFFNEQVNVGNHRVLDWENTKTDSLNTLKLFVVGDYLDETEIAELQGKIKDYSATQYDLKVVSLEQEPPDLDKMSEELQLQNLKQIEATRNEIEKLIDEKLDSMFVKTDAKFIKLEKLTVLMDSVKNENKLLENYILTSELIDAETQTERQLVLLKYTDKTKATDKLDFEALFMQKGFLNVKVKEF